MLLASIIVSLVVLFLLYAVFVVVAFWKKICEFFFLLIVLFFFYGKACYTNTTANDYSVRIAKILLVAVMLFCLIYWLGK